MWRKLLLIEINAIFLCILSVYSSPRVKKSLRFIPIFFVIVSFHIFTFNAVDDVENPLKTLCSTIEYLIWEFKRALVTEKMSKLRILGEVL